MAMIIECDHCGEVRSSVSESSGMCEGCEQEFLYCSICDEWRLDEPGELCVHVWFSNSLQEMAGPGSSEAHRLRDHLDHFRWVVSRLGHGAVEALVSALESGEDWNYQFVHATGGLGSSFCSWSLGGDPKFGEMVAALQNIPGVDEHRDGISWLLSLTVEAEEARAETLAALRQVTTISTAFSTQELVDSLPEGVRGLVDRAAKEKVRRSVSGSWCWEDGWIAEKLARERREVVAAMVEHGLAAAGEDDRVARDRRLPPPHCRFKGHGDDVLEVSLMTYRDVEKQIADKEKRNAEDFAAESDRGEEAASERG